MERFALFVICDYDKLEFILVKCAIFNLFAIFVALCFGGISYQVYICIMRICLFSVGVSCDQSSITTHIKRH